MGAIVKINGTVVGRTPIINEQYPVGRHTVRLRLDGYGDVSKVANIEAGQHTDLATIPLQDNTPKTGQVTLWSDNLIGATIYIDNKHYGKLPVKVMLTEGKHRFFITPTEGEPFHVDREVQFDVEGIGISLKLNR